MRASKSLGPSRRNFPSVCSVFGPTCGPAGESQCVTEVPVMAVRESAVLETDTPPQTVALSPTLVGVLPAHAGPRDRGLGLHSSLAASSAATSQGPGWEASAAFDRVSRGPTLGRGDSGGREPRATRLGTARPRYSRKSQPHLT